jgi:hypothetical protein
VLFALRKQPFINFQLAAFYFLRYSKNGNDYQERRISRLWPSGEAAVATPQRHTDVTSQRIVAIDAELHMSLGIKNKEDVTMVKNVRTLANKTGAWINRILITVAFVGCLSSAPWTKV